MLEPLAADAPEEVLPELVRLVRQMSSQAGQALDERAAQRGDATAAEFLIAQEVARSVESGADVDPEALMAALTVIRGLYEDLRKGA